MNLRSYQSTAVSETLAHLHAGKSTLLVAPTGAGKMVMAAAIAKSFRNPLYIAHRRELVGQARDTFGRNACVHSVQSILNLNDAPRNVGLLVIDEAHRSPADTYRKVIERYPDAARLGLTATPVRTDGQGLCDAFSVLVQASNMQELVAQGHLVPYRAFEAPDEALKELAWMKRVGGDYATSALSSLMNQPRLVGDIVREYNARAAGRKAIAFAVSVEHSLTMCEAFRAAGIRAAHVDGRTAARSRDAALYSLRSGDLDVLCNVNLFTEGWDCPPVSCVIMARPTASLTLYLQCVGRGMRPFAGKQDLLIFDHAGNMQRHGYPEVDRAWSLESEQQKTKREAEARERARLAALGFESVEAELEERQRQINKRVGLISLREFARRKQVALYTVQKAIVAGKFSLVEGMIDPAAAAAPAAWMPSSGHAGKPIGSLQAGLISLREFARRKGVSLYAVQKAIATGKLLTGGSDLGCRAGIDPDAAWARKKRRKS